MGSAQGREDQEVQPHAHREVELSHESHDLPGRVPAPENFSSLRVLHVGYHAVAVLDIGPFHRDEHDVGVIPVDHEVCRVRQQCVVIFRVDVRGGGTRLSHREADQMPAEFDALWPESRGRCRRCPGWDVSLVSGWGSAGLSWSFSRRSPPLEPVISQLTGRRRRSDAAGLGAPATQDQPCPLWM